MFANIRQPFSDTCWYLLVPARCHIVCPLVMGLSYVQKNSEVLTINSGKSERPGAKPTCYQSVFTTHAAQAVLKKPHAAKAV